MKYSEPTPAAVKLNASVLLLSTPALLSPDTLSALNSLSGWSRTVSPLIQVLFLFCRFSLRHFFFFQNFLTCANGFCCCLGSVWV